MNYVLDIHALHTVPAANLNRDENGTPKSVVYGGVRRSRVSSQAWKKVIRDGFDTGSIRSRRVADYLIERMIAADPTVANAAESVVEQLLKAAGIVKAKENKASMREIALTLLSREQLDAISELGLTAATSDDPAAWFAEKEHKAALKAAFKERNGADIALFGRMMASNQDFSVEAAAMVAHAFGVGRLTAEWDFYTAMDDHPAAAAEGEGGHAGGAMMGTIGYNSATFYRYASVDLGQLAGNLAGDQEAAIKVATDFVRLFVTEIPGGKLATFGNRTLPSYVRLVLRDDLATNLSEAFLRPVDGDAEEDMARRAAGLLESQAAKIDTFLGHEPVAVVVAGTQDGAASLPEAISTIAVAIKDGWQ